MTRYISNRTAKIPNINKQRGAVSLLVSIVILTLITFISIYTSKSILLEQKISNNDYRSKQAFEAAEAGINAAVDYLSVNPDRDEATNPGVDPIYDTDNDNVGDANSTLVAGANLVEVSVTDESGGDLTILAIEAVGYSDDRTATRTIYRTLSTLDPLPNLPDNPLITRGMLTVTGSATIYNPEGHSTIWSGGDVELGSNNATATEVADVTDPAYPACMDNSMSCATTQSSNKVTVGLDVIEHDSNLNNLTPVEMFENFFGMPLTTFRESMVTLDTLPADVDTDVQLANEEIIWVEGDTTIDGLTVGCTVVVTGNNKCGDAGWGSYKPSILIINGNATFTGNPQFYGIVFVTGSISISGSTTVVGALVTAGDIVNNAGGSLDVWYNSDVLAQTRANGPLGTSSGTWRDFCNPSPCV